MRTLRIIGDVHAQFDEVDLCVPGASPYVALVRTAEYSVQVGDMGDGETYDQLREHVDPQRHRFVPGNHETFDRLPPHSLGDYGSAAVGDVSFFFIRGAFSTDRAKRLALGRRLGKKLWFEEEELTAPQMALAKRAYLEDRPQIVITHDAPSQIAFGAWRHAAAQRHPDPEAKFLPSRTNSFLEDLFNGHQPKIWLFGHHHYNWRGQLGRTLFVCVGQLSCVDISACGSLIDEPPMAN